ncbi:MAG: acetate--CoA ligase family protein [Chloroflexi bacterium]|nr:acetate--CoA ligase family protein [Chloroflexota bacterium]
MKASRSDGYKPVQEFTRVMKDPAADSATKHGTEGTIFEESKAVSIDSLNVFFNPSSIAVIGASTRKGSIGNELFRDLVCQGYNGVVYPVHPQAEAVASIKAYPSVLDIPGNVDLAIIIVPADTVQQVVEQCGKKGVRGIVVISAGFAESGGEGVARQERLFETVRRYGMRLIGPNCMGVINTDPLVNMNATFSPVFPPAGKVAFSTQSGALGLAILEYARTLNIGISSFVSLGNRVDVSSNDLLEYWEQDPATDVILLYLESFGNPRRFVRISRNLTRKKPVIAVKSGRTPAGSRAAASHTGALATADVASEALFAQAGIIRVDTLEELFDVANLLTNQPVPRGRNVAILTNGGGPGILTADACAARGLELPVLSQATLSGLRNFLPERSSLANPIDMTAEATAEHYGKAMQLLLQDERIHIVIVVFVPPIVIQPEAVAAAIRELSPQYCEQGKTLVASFMGVRGAAIELGSQEGCCVPSFAFPEATATAISKACEYNEWLAQPKGSVRFPHGIDKIRGEQIVKSAIERAKERPVWLDAQSVSELLDAYGIRTVPSKQARTIEQAAEVARELGYPVAVKLMSAAVTHKSDVGGVKLDLHSAKEVERAFRQIKEQMNGMKMGSLMEGVTIQQMVSEGVEVIVGITQDPSFGPLILFGMGGIYAEFFKDVAFRIHPLTDVDARNMVRSVKAYHLLEGFRGAEPSDIKALEQLLLRVSRMAEDLPQIKELDLNPVKALKTGYAVVDARILLF